jgi:hypothetical protein
MHLPLIVTLVIALPLDQVLQAVVTHSAIQYHPYLILLSSPLTRVGGGGGACCQPGMGSGSVGDSLTMGKTGWRQQK